MLIWVILGGVGLICAAGAAAWFPMLATASWILVIEATPDLWQAGDHEALLGGMKGAGVALVLVLGLREGWRRDRYNPGFAFASMFVTGLLHGLYPGLTVLSSLRSLIGSAGPFAFSFVKTGNNFRGLVTRMTVLGPLVNVTAGVVLSVWHIHPLFNVEGGVLRLAGAGQPAFLGGFALIAVYAGLMEILRREDAGINSSLDYVLLVVNAAVLLLSGAPHAAWAGRHIDPRDVSASQADNGTCSRGSVAGPGSNLCRAVQLYSRGQFAAGWTGRKSFQPEPDLAGLRGCNRLLAMDWVGGWGRQTNRAGHPPASDRLLAPRLRITNIYGSAARAVSSA